MTKSRFFGELFLQKNLYNLAHCTPHKLRHTTATLAKLNGMSLEKISEGLTHSETSTTKAYINSNNIIELTPADFTYNKIFKTNGGDS